MFVDLKTLTVEELIGRLRAVDESLDDKTEQIMDKVGRLMLAKEDWMEKHKHRFYAGNKAGGTVVVASPQRARRRRSQAVPWGWSN